MITLAIVFSLGALTGALITAVVFYLMCDDCDCGYCDRMEKESRN